MFSEIQKSTFDQVAKQATTPFYYYDIDLLEKTVKTLVSQATKYGYQPKYAIKANSNLRILKTIQGFGLGADCVSIGEVEAAIEAGFEAQKIVFAGVGKTDHEIIKAIQLGIFAFNCESEQELDVINELAAKEGKKAPIMLRINPNVDADTHHYITTGLNENKFGINLWQLQTIIAKLKIWTNLEFLGLHFHIGSQITKTEPFVNLCKTVNQIVKTFADSGNPIQHLNMGGGLGIDYLNPIENNIPDYKTYFETFNANLEIPKEITVHIEPGRSVVGQCGCLITKVLYVKPLTEKTFVIVDAGMTDLIRPALYGSHHEIRNITQKGGETAVYDVVGPICESSDKFRTDITLPISKRGDLLAILSAGAYGEVMASNYNLRKKPLSYYSK